MRLLAIALVATALLTPDAMARKFKTVVFDLELIDSSLEGDSGERADQTRRLALASAELRRLLSESAQLSIVDLSPRAGEIREKSPLFKCNGCDEDIAKALGADLEVTSVVQKTSNLILSFSMSIKDLRDGKVLRAGSVDIRGNSDETWLRGVRWLVRNRLLDQPLPEPQ